MAEQLGSFRHAQNILKLSYAKQGFNFDRLGDPFTQAFIVDVSTSNYAAYFVFLDEVIAIYHNINHALICSIAAQKDGAAVDYRFYNACLSALRAIRMLLGNGYDLEARVQLRSFRELLIAWLYFDKYPEAKKGFIDVKTLQEGNRFWYEHTRHASKKLKAITKEGEFHPGMDAIFDEIDLVLNTAAHPSWVGIDVTARSDFHSSNDSLVRKEITSSSRFTLSSTLAFAMFAVYPFRDLNFEIQSEMENLFPKHKTIDRASDAMVELQKTIGTIFLMSTRLNEHFQALEKL